MNSSTPTSLSPWRVLGIGTLIILLFEALAIVVGAHTGFLPVFFLSLLGVFVIGGLSSTYIKEWGLGAACTGFMVGMVIVGSNAARPIWLSFTQGSKTLDHAISVSDAPNYDVTLFKFTDGVVFPKHYGFYAEEAYVTTRTGGRGYNSRTEYYVAPVVPEDWETGDEIPVWVVCSDTWNTDDDIGDVSACMKSWTNDYRAGVEIDPTDRADVLEAVKNAEKDYEFRSHSNAKFIIWDWDAESTAAVTTGGPVAVMVLTHLGFAITVLVKRKQIV